MSIRGFFTGKTAPSEAAVEKPRSPATANELFEISRQLAYGLPSILSTEQDWWWFVVEQYDRTTEYPKVAKDFLSSNFPLPLFDIEYEGMRSEQSYVNAPNPGVRFIEQSVEKMSNALPDGIPHLMATHAFVLFCAEHKKSINRLRLKYAVHFHNNCIASHSLNSADRWSEVIESLGGD